MGVEVGGSVPVGVSVGVSVTVDVSEGVTVRVAVPVGARAVSVEAMAACTALSCDTKVTVPLAISITPTPIAVIRIGNRAFR